MSANIKQLIETEIANAADLVDQGELEAAFRHLERAHILGQAITFEHTRVHWLMLKIGWKLKDWREIFGQLFRIVGASTKTPFGIFPVGNSGGANVSPFRKMSIPDDLQTAIQAAKKFTK
ncbi:MAG: DUF3703 domain-containing protein [Pyrinomonadaceae bacterium]